MIITIIDKAIGEAHWEAKTQGEEEEQVQLSCNQTSAIIIYFKFPPLEQTL